MKTPSLSATLLTNVVTSAMAGVALLAAPALIGDLMGDVPAWLCRLVGAGLLLFAAWVYWVRGNLPASGPWVAWVLGLDLAWILATPVVMLIFADQLNLWGKLLLIDVALIVTGFAALERYWLGRMKRDACIN